MISSYKKEVLEISNKLLLKTNKSMLNKQIRVIWKDGSYQVMSGQEALLSSNSKDVDLVIVDAKSDPIVVKAIDDYSKWSFQKKKKQQQQVKKTQKLKGVILRPGTAEADFQVKMKSIMNFLEKGDKVKISIKFKGREIAHKEDGYEKLNRCVELAKDISFVEFGPKLEGRQLALTLSPKKK